MHLPRFARAALIAILFGVASLAVAGERVAVAAAADLRFALDEIVRLFRADHPAVEVSVSYGSSGKFLTQIQNGAPYDLYLSADSTYPREIDKAGLAAAPPVTYAVGRIVLWSAGRDASKLTLDDLAAPAIGKVAIANTQHAPYGRRAEEALRARGVWTTVAAKAVFGENISQTAQFVETGNADVGIIALSLAMHPSLAERGGYALIPDNLHQPLEQSLVVLRRGDREAVREFAGFIMKPAAQGVLRRYGFQPPPKSASR
jgi:molybdate transport system substrate-binding protein